MTEIGERAFAGCIHVKQLHIPDTVVKIGKDAFLDVPCILYNGSDHSDDNWGAKHWERDARQGKCGKNLTWRLENRVVYIEGHGNMESCEHYPWEPYRKEIVRVEFSSGCTSVGAYAFEDCENLEAVVFPEGFRSIGEGAFHNCMELWDVSVPCSVYAMVPHSITEIGNFAFYNCVNLELLLPNPNVKWGEDSFYDTKWIMIGRDHW